MAVTSTRRIINRFLSDDNVVDMLSVKEADSAASPAVVDTVALNTGANTITPPIDAIAVTIIFPSDNVELVTLKGITGDTGIVLHPTDPTSIGLNSDTDTFVLTAAAGIEGVRLIWS